MKHVFLLIFCALNFLFGSAVANNSFPAFYPVYRKCQITSATHGGRFGDQLLLLLSTLWISEKHHIPYAYSSNYWLDNLEISNSSRVNRHYYKHIILQKELDLFKIVKKPMLIEIPYGFYGIGWDSNILLHNWKEVRNSRFFIEKFRRAIKLKDSTQYQLMVPPQDCASIAVHIRFLEPGWPQLFSKQIFSDASTQFKFFPKHDRSQPYADQQFPLKFPPLQYYIDAINYLISNVIEDSNIYVHIFTDYFDPRVLIDEIQKHVSPIQKIKFGFQNQMGNESRSELESTYTDFYSLLNFDYLIRSGESNFSQMAQIAKDYKGVIFSTGYNWNGDCLEMVNIHVELNNELVEILNRK